MCCFEATSFSQRNHQTASFFCDQQKFSYSVLVEFTAAEGHKFLLCKCVFWNCFWADYFPCCTCSVMPVWVSLLTCQSMSGCERMMASFASLCLKCCSKWIYLCEFRSKLCECVELWMLAWMICACSLIVSESMNNFPVSASGRPLLQNHLATISLCSIGKGERRDDQIYLITL